MNGASAAEPFGTRPDERPVERWTLRNGGGVQPRGLSVGGTITELLPDRHGEVAVTDALTEANELRLDDPATTDAPTVVDLTNHSDFNPGGDTSGTADRHHIAIAADHFLPVDPSLIPDGPPAPVKGTPFDLRRPVEVGRALAQAYPHLRCGGGPAALASHPGPGRRSRRTTTQPASQFHTGNVLDGTVPGRTEAAYRRAASVALETQHPPNSPNRADLPSTRLDPGEPAHWSTVFAFGASDRMPDWPG